MHRKGLRESRKVNRRPCLPSQYCEEERRDRKSYKRVRSSRSGAIEPRKVRYSQKGEVSSIFAPASISPFDTARNAVVSVQLSWIK